MPEKAVVTLRYGPYMNCSGVVQHRLSRLEGLRAVLAFDGHSVVLEEIPHLNAVELIVNGETIFQCNIKELEFGGDGLLDPLCEDARQAVLRAY
ncbi:PREDICTED: UPF0728 protein C10orf53 homolog [Nanorana parkeri]|uniref:UPF0728 protein C10orf53 homolog n=1 Tax=Nanorana parkeri TaxID=125878 RepID=UPI000854869B|nr:PREDICTED: UPF0728 protein C10orf53 homolog [Nanorana parkeri]